MMVCSGIYNMVMQMLPNGIGFNETQNELELMNLFDQPSFYRLLFVNCNWCTISGGNIFRHLLIGELGKKFNAIVMGLFQPFYFH